MSSWHGVVAVGRSRSVPAGSRCVRSVLGPITRGRFHTSTTSLADERPSSEAPKSKRAAAEQAFSQIRKLPQSHDNSPQPPKMLLRRVSPRPESPSRAAPPQRTIDRRSDTRPSRGRGDGQRGRGTRRRNNDRASNPKRRTPRRSNDQDGDANMALIDAELYGNPKLQTPRAWLDTVHGDYFAGGLPESNAYADAMEVVGDVRTAIQDLEAAQSRNDTAAIATLESRLADLDARVANRMSELVRMLDTTYPTHKPHDLDPDTYYRGETGAVGAGAGGGGNVVEDALRHVGRREGHKWREPRALARRVLAGEPVKFIGALERAEVLAALRQLQALGEGEGAEIVEPSAGARREIARRMAAGLYEDPGDRNIQDDMLRGVARVVGGRYRGDAKATMLRTIEEMLPGSRQQSAKRA